MTKKELLEALAPYPDDAVIDMRYSEDHADMEIDGIAQVEDNRPFGGFLWVTLGFGT